MSRRNSRSLRLLAATLTFAVLGVACGGGEDQAAPPPRPTETTLPPVPTGPDTVAAQLRSSLDNLLEEHVVLVTATTNASLGGRSDESTGASRALEANSEALTTAIGSVFGPEAATAFGPLWKKHIQLFMNYAQGQQQAVNELLAYTKEFGAFLNSALPDLPADAVAELVKQHVLSVKDVIDAQRAGDENRAYTNLRTAMAHMGSIAEALAAATSAKFPERVSGDPKSPEATLLVTLSSGLREHVFLTAAATGAALGGRQDEFTAAKTALDANSDALAAAIASVYGPDTGRAFDPLWKRHIGFFVDYTTGLVANDRAKQDKAVQDLIAYTATFGAFINSASPALPPDTVGELVKTHVLTLKDTIDAQGKKDFLKAYNDMRVAADHMTMIAKPLAGTIVTQFPKKF